VACDNATTTPTIRGFTVTRSRLMLGAAGEELAAAWYRDHGYEVVARNWRVREGELDIVARRGRLLVFCEVKTRRTDAYGSPASAVTADKQARIRRLASIYLRTEHVGPRRLRFDVAAVLSGRLTMIERAF
jgi:putative endonuclease